MGGRLIAFSSRYPALKIFSCLQWLIPDKWLSGVLLTSITQYVKYHIVLHNTRDSRNDPESML